MCLRLPETGQAYKCNKVHLEKFFIQESSVLFVEILESSNTERMIDHFIVNGEFILFTVMLLITEKYENTDISTLHYVKARNHIENMARDFDSLEFYHRLMTSGKNKKAFDSILQKEKSKISWTI